MNKKEKNPYLTSKNEWFLDMTDKPPEGFEDCKNIGELLDKLSELDYTLVAKKIEPLEKVKK